MGTYDTLHGGDYCGQVKCLGKRMGDLEPGDKASLYVFPSGQREQKIINSMPDDIYANDSPWWLLAKGEKSDTKSWQIRMDIGFAVFIDHVFVAWEGEARSGILIVGNHGRPSLEDTIDERFGADHGYGAPARRCAVCAIVRKSAPIEQVVP